MPGSWLWSPVTVVPMRIRGALALRAKGVASAYKFDDLYLPLIMPLTRVLAVSALSTSLIVVVLWLTWNRARKRKPDRAAVNRVLFFPDSASAQFISSSNHGQALNSFTFPHERQDTGSVWELFKILQCANHSIDVCVLIVASRELSDVLISAHQAGVIVRVVTNNEQMMHSGTQVNRLRRAGIQVCIDETAFLMHHKFVVVDKELLVTGSLNWTTQALCGNQENVIITSESKLVQPFISQFEILWKQYNPQSST